MAELAASSAVSGGATSPALSIWGQSAPSSSVRDYIALLKPRVMSLVVFCGMVGMFLAPGSLHPALQVVTVLCIALGAGASGAINMWYDRDIDARMLRTLHRPIPSGRVDPAEALSFGVIVAFFAVILLGMATNWVAAFLLSLAIATYIGVYTIWLKRRTPQNIVIGGAAGAFPPMIGWAAVTGGVSIESLVLFAIIFFWTPPHFWALALYRSDDYARVGVPMLPVVAGKETTRRHILGYSFLVIALSAMPYGVGMSGVFYLATSAILGAIFIWCALAVQYDETDRTPRRLFFYSMAYLFMLFAALVVDRLLA